MNELANYLCRNSFVAVLEVKHDFGDEKTACIGHGRRYDPKAYHAVVVVGYDTDNYGGAPTWKFLNSYGLNWGHRV